MVTLPAFTPVTVPLLSTVAMLVSELLQLIAGKLSVLVSVPPLFMVYTSLEGFTVTVWPTLHASADLVISNVPDEIATASTFTVGCRACIYYFW